MNPNDDAYQKSRKAGKQRNRKARKQRSRKAGKRESRETGKRDSREVEKQRSRKAKKRRSREAEKVESKKNKTLRNTGSKLCLTLFEYNFKERRLSDLTVMSPHQSQLPHNRLQKFVGIYVVRIRVSQPACFCSSFRN